MWRWHQSGRSRLWIHIIAGCSVIHVSMLALLFLVYRGSVDTYTITMSQALSTQHVILLPLHKTLSKTHALSAPQTHASAIDTQSASVERQAPAQRETKATTLAATPKSKTNPPAPRLRRAGKKSKKATREKKSKKHVKEKSKKIKESPKPEKKKIAEQKPIEKPAPAADNQVAMALPADAQQAVYVGQLEYEALQLQEAVQRELQTHWKPPIGSTGLTCTLCVMLDWQGAISDIIVEQTSEVLMFDMSAEQAINAMTFPKTAWGKQVTITFN